MSDRTQRRKSIIRELVSISNHTFIHLRLKTRKRFLLKYRLKSDHFTWSTHKQAKQPAVAHNISNKVDQVVLNTYDSNLEQFFILNYIGRSMKFATYRAFNVG